MCTNALEEYAHPDILVDIRWLLDHDTDSNVEVVEVDYDPISNYDQGHIPGAVLFDWKTDLGDDQTTFKASGPDEKIGSSRGRLHEARLVDFNV